MTRSAGTPRPTSSSFDGLLTATIRSAAKRLASSISAISPSNGIRLVSQLREIQMLEPLYSHT